MAQCTIEHRCSYCKRINSRSYFWIDPRKFTNPEKAVSTSAFHCAFCSRGQALKVKFLPDQKLQAVEPVDFKTLIKDDPAPFYIGGATSEEENNIEHLSENSALSMMIDEE